MKLQFSTTFSAAILLAISFGQVRGQDEEVKLSLKGIWLDEPGRQMSGVQVVGNYAFISERLWTVTNRSGGLTILEVSDPANPTPVGHLDLTAEVHDLKIANGYAYLACGSWATGTNDPGSLEIVDVGNPARPARIGGVNTSGRAQRVRLAGSLAYLPLSKHWTGTNLLGACAIYDVSNPTNPVPVGSYDTEGSATDVQVVGNCAYLADGVADLMILDVTNPSHPTRLGSYSTNLPINPNIGFGGGPATFIESVGGLIYTSGSGEYHAFDVSDPQNPARLGFNHEAGYSPSAVAQAGKYFCTSIDFPGPSNPEGYLYLEDVSDPYHPRYAGGLSAVTAWIANGMHIVGKRLYVVAGYFGLLIFDIELVPRITSILRDGGKVVLSWRAEPDFKLQRTGSLSVPDWKDVPGSLGLSSMEIPITGDQDFFRLAKE